jgi:DNA-binding transcriptional MerR regulator
MRTGELARKVGVSADTIRHYERLGLFHAAPRTQSGYREYPQESLVRVRLIRQALSVGFSLEDLAGILRVRDSGGVPCHDVFATAKLKTKELDQQVRKLKAARRRLARVLKEWTLRLARAPKGQPARLLENLPGKMEEHSHAIHRDVRRNLRPRRSGARPNARPRPA